MHELFGDESYGVEVGVVMSWVERVGGCSNSSLDFGGGGLGVCCFVFRVWL